MPRSSASRKPQQSETLGGTGTTGSGDLAAVGSRRTKPGSTKIQTCPRHTTGTGVKNLEGSSTRETELVDGSMTTAPVDVHGVVASLQNDQPAVGRD